ncbi:GNAT family N-acetyltransferase [Sphingomonas sp.]|uniref:GNAT family N-acetyltransferase n=1 Tax=Sphingomonas sp. TaxID=28214 RepID=UPI002EDAC6AE
MSAPAPNFAAGGLAAMLAQAVAGRIAGRGKIPFPHAYAHNGNAIGLYEALGFRLRRELVITVPSPI